MRPSTISVRLVRYVYRPYMHAQQKVGLAHAREVIGGGAVSKLTYT